MLSRSIRAILFYPFEAMMQLQRCLNKHKRRVLWPRHFVVGHNGHYSHNPRVVTVVTVVSGGRFLVPGHNPRVVTSHQRAICYPSKKEGKDDIKGGLVPPIHNPPGAGGHQFTTQLGFIRRHTMNRGTQLTYLHHDLFARNRIYPSLSPCYSLILM
jgi:hypothetical protein